MPTPVTSHGIKMRMLTAKEFASLPDGTVLQSVITHGIVTKGTDDIDLDTRGGQISYALQGWDD